MGTSNIKKETYPNLFLKKELNFFFFSYIVYFKNYLRTYFWFRGCQHARYEQNLHHTGYAARWH